MGNIKTKLLSSLLILALCISGFAGSTFAWFTDSVSSSDNIIKSGKLDIAMYWTDKLDGDNTVWNNVEGDTNTAMFNHDKWEPGYTDVRYIKIVNEGNLALNYEITLESEGSVGKLAEVINVYFSDKNEENITSREQLNGFTSLGLLNRAMNGGAKAKGTLLASGQSNPSYKSGETIVTLGLSMLTTAGNEYQNETIGEGGFKIKALATQCPFESDSFGADYDGNAEMPESIQFTEITFPLENGAIPEGGIELVGANGVRAFVPDTVKLADGAKELKLTVKPLKESTSGITAVNSQVLIPVDVHIEGVADDNQTAIPIDLGPVMPKYLNFGNYTLIHVEAGVNQEMTCVADKNDLNDHNDFTYDPVTGEVTLALKSFSEVAVLADMENGWKGEYDYSWYVARSSEYTIANADQLAAFGAIVGGMNGQTKDSFAGKTVKLLSDINLGDAEKENNPDIIFYPIGYYNSTGSYEAQRAVTGITSSVSSFEGTFDGNGHTIANFYQNTWEMFGDYNDGYSGTPNYYKDAMGLFGYVVNGTVKNLTVENFKSDGEFTPTGVIAAYADGNSTFENIAITKCNPRVYNTGNGGIIGIAGDTSAANDDHITLKNITVDNSNKISALWGSWDVACGGLVGMYRGNVDGSGNATGDKINFENCHVSAQIDVYNDVCANYQYYAYRYSGMIIGSVRHNTTTTEGKTIPNMTGISASGCTVHFGTWNDYYYCELVDNTIASYTHDYQMSRLVEIKAINGTTITKLDGTTDTVPASGRANYVIVDYSKGHGTENATCYHFKNGEVWNHEYGGTETINGVEVLKEDKKHLYLEFNNLFTGYGWGVSSMGINKWNGITALDVELGEQEKSVEKFETKFTGNFLYRIGNANPVSVGDLFAAATCKDEEGNTIYNEDGTSKIYDITNDGVWVTVEKVDDKSNAGGVFTPAKDKEEWTKGTIEFSGTGVVKVTIQDYNFCTPTVLMLEVVNAKNITKAESAIANDVVLLNDISGTFTVSNGHTFYGNGFTVTLPTSSVQEVGQGFTGYVSIGATADSGNGNGGNLDNVIIKGPVYPEMYIYRDQARITSSSDPDYGNGNNMRYFKNSVIIYGGNVNISNCYISGSRTALCLRGGNNVVIENTTLSGGAYANMQICAGSSVTLRDLTTVQTDVADSYGKGKKAHGLGIAVDSDVVDIYIEGALNQYNWLNQTQWRAIVPSGYQSQFPSFFTNKTFNKYWHYLNGGSDPYVNLAFIFACNWNTSKIHDNRAAVDYGTTNATINGVEGGVYSKVNTIGGNAITDVDLGNPVYTAPGYNPVAPLLDFNNTPNHDADDANDANDTYCVYNESTGILKIGVSGSSKTLDLSKVSVNKNGTDLVYEAYLNGTKINGNYVTINADAGAKQNLTFKATSNDAGYDKNGKPIEGSIEYTWTVTVEIATLSYPAPVWNMGGNYTFGAKVNCIFVEYNSDYGEAVPIYEGIKVTYYNKNGKKIEKDFSGTTAIPTGSNNSNANAFIYTLEDGSTLSMKFSSGWKSGATTHQFATYNKNGKKVYIYPQSLDNSNYARNEKTAQDFNVKISYTFTDPNGQTISQTMQWYNAKDSNNNVTEVQWKTFDSTNGKKPTCITPDTLITLADGSQVRVDSLTGDEMLMVWNHTTGTIDTAPIAYIVNHDKEVREQEVIHLYFEDGTDIEIIGEHVFYDVDLNKYVTLDANAEQSIGHKFLTSPNEDGTMNAAALVKVEKEVRETAAYEVVTDKHLTCFTNGVLSASAYMDKLLNIFDVNPETMGYTMEDIQSDIETYGLYSYEDFEGLISEEAFELYNAKYLKIAVGKGYITWDDVLELIDIYFNVEVNPLV